MKSFTQFVSEGVHDPAKFKAIFLAGGPGSGKSFVTRNVTGDLGFKMVNSDHALEAGMKKHGLDMKMPEHEADARNAVRDRAKALTQSKSDLYQHGRLGMVIDGTGKDYAKIVHHSNELRKLGYDTHMIFVNTSLDVAHQRNQKRARTVPSHLVDQGWHAVQDNMGKFQHHFGNDKFLVVDNNHRNDDLLTSVYKNVQKIANSPVTNPIAQRWIDKEMAKKTK